MVTVPCFECGLRPSKFFHNKQTRFTQDGERIVACRYGTAGDSTETELGATLYLSLLPWFE